MNHFSERIWYLEVQNKALQNQLDSFRSGNAYVKLRNEYESVIHEKDREIRELEKELSVAHVQNIQNRKNWFFVYEDVEKETRQAIQKKDKEIERLRKRAIEAERQRDDALDRAKEWREKYYELSGQTQDLEGLVKKLTAQVNKDFENSSLPSSSQGQREKRFLTQELKRDAAAEDKKGMSLTGLLREKPRKNIIFPIHRSM